jgi:hypothetical protein
MFEHCKHRQKICAFCTQGKAVLFCGLIQEKIDDLLDCPLDRQGRQGRGQGRGKCHGNYKSKHTQPNVSKFQKETKKKEEKGQKTFWQNYEEGR